jgi:dihydrofolate synthase/folylpolyglutamate synthase
MVDTMGDPQHAYPVIHLTGTNGKGSTARMITALLGASGLSVGTYTSPHLNRINERLSWNGQAISDDELAEQVTAVAEIERLAGVDASHFDLITAIAFRWFADLAVDVAVLEVGVLGRWDATNVADAEVAVVTNVGIDHVDYVGSADRGAIAREKVGIVKPGSTLILGETDEELAPIFEEAGAKRTWRRHEDFDCDENLVAVGGRLLDLRTPGATIEDVYLPLHGAHQGDNAAIALAAVEAFFDRPIDSDVVREAFATLSIPGRFEIVQRDPVVILDGAHNAHGAAAARETLDEDFAGAAGRILVFGTFKEHDPVEMLEALGVDAVRLVITCTAPWPRAIPAADLADAARSLGLDAIAIDDPVAATRRATAEANEGEIVLVTGSLYVVGAVRAGLELR